MVGGYVPSNLGIDSLVVGVYRGKDLIYAARVRAGLVPASRLEVFEQLKHRKTPSCPFVNLPEAAAGRWGQGLTAEKMEECVWVRPEVVAEIQFLEWTGADHLRHTKFVRLRCDSVTSVAWSARLSVMLYVSGERGIARVADSVSSIESR